jgi:hypothetical protein
MFFEVYCDVFLLSNCFLDTEDSARQGGISVTTEHSGLFSMIRRLTCLVF